MKTPNLTRRDVLKLTGTFAMGTIALPPVLRMTPSRAVMMQPREFERTPETPYAPPLPPLEVIALNRIAFGPRPGDLEVFRALPGANALEKLQNYVEQQLSPEKIDDGECDIRLAAAKLTTLSKPLEQLWADHVVNNKMKDTDSGWEFMMLPFYETRAATFIRAAYSRRQLIQVLADFWHNHFNVYGMNDDAGPVFAHYDREVIRTYALGNFRQMLEAVATSSAMLFYLDNSTNSNAGPNENYARELFELHTLGVENYLGVRDPMSVPGFDQHNSSGYVDNDVYEAARCFTGWRVSDNEDGEEEGVGNRGSFRYYKPWHDRFNKIVLGRYIPSDQPDMKDGRDVLSLVAYHPATARHIARKLCRRFIGDQPPDRVVNAAAETFLAKRDAPDQLKHVMRTILLSEEFRTTWGTKIKRPFEATVSTLRALNVNFVALPDAFFDYYAPMGQSLFEHTAPNGYPDVKEPWANTMSLLSRWNFVHALLEGWIADDNGTGLTIDLAKQMPSDIRTSEAIADYWINRILGRPMSPDSSRVNIVRLLAGKSSPSQILSADVIAERLPRAVELTLASPDFQWR